MDDLAKMKGDSVNPSNSQGSFSPEQTSLKRYYWCDICKAMQEDIIDDNTILQLPSDFVPLDIPISDNDNTFDFAESPTSTTTTTTTSSSTTTTSTPSSSLSLSPITNSIQNNLTLTLSPLNQSQSQSQSQQQSTFNISSPPSNFSLFSNSNTEEWNFVCDNFSPLFNLDCEVSLNDDFIQQILNPNFEEPAQNSNVTSNSNSNNSSNNNNNNLLTGK